MGGMTEAKKKEGVEGIAGSVEMTANRGGQKLKGNTTTWAGRDENEADSTTHEAER